MGYEYDIFISYRRTDFTRKWIEEYFVPKLKLFVFLEIDIEPTVFIDDQIEFGDTWPATLGNALGKSKVIIPLWSKNYLKSIWCTCEISHMLQRESKAGYRTAQKPNGLVFPTIIHDGETMPAPLLIIQKIEIQKYFKPIAKDSIAAEEFHEKLEPLGKIVANAIEQAPAWQEEWQTEAVGDFFDLFYNANKIQQSTPPKLGSK